VTLEQLRAWRDHQAEKSVEPKFMGKPESWYENRHWFCINGHVSGYILRCEEDGDRCLACRAPVLLGPAIGEAEFADVLSRT